MLLALIALLLAGWGLGEFTESATQAADLDVVRDIAAQRSSLLISLAHAFSWAGSGFVIFPIGVLLYAVLYGRGRHASALVLAVSALGALVISNVDKAAVARPRPPVHHLEAVASASFPSGHATEATAFYLAALLVLLAGTPRRVLMVATAVATALLIVGVALSRVYLGVHYPSDVAAGVLLGGAWTLIVWQMAARGGRPPRSQPAQGFGAN